MRYRIKVREISEVTHEVEVPDDFKPPHDLDDWCNQIAESDGLPEIHDVQIDSVLSATRVIES